jgi:hypothetical protein
MTVDHPTNCRACKRRPVVPRLALKKRVATIEISEVPMSIQFDSIDASLSATWESINMMDTPYGRFSLFIYTIMLYLVKQKPRKHAIQHSQ